jgi:hypothetical protein
VNQLSLPLIKITSRKKKKKDVFMLPSLDTHELTLRVGRGCKELHLFKCRYTVQFSILKRKSISSDINVYCS